jgi:hypothetical protein
VWIQSTHKRHVIIIIIIDVTHGRISVRIKNASFVTRDAVGSDVAIPSNTIPRGQRWEGHVVVIFEEHQSFAI